MSGTIAPRIQSRTDGPFRPEARLRSLPVLSLLAVLIPGIFFRFFHLGTIFFNRDEPLHQIRISYQSLSFVIANNNGPLFSILVHFLLPLGRMELMSRLVSATSGVATVVLAYLIGKLLFSRAEGLVAALFVACSHLLIFYSQQSRSYALFGALAMASLFFFLKAVRVGRTRDWALFALATGLTIYTHIVGFLILPAFAAYSGAAWLRGRLAVRQGKPASRDSALWKPFLLWTGGSVAVVAALLWPSSWVKGFFLGSVQRSLGQPSQSARLTLDFIHHTLLYQISPLSVPLYVTTLVLILAGSISIFRRDRLTFVFLMTYVIAPWLPFLVVTPREEEIYAFYRYFAYLLPVLFLLTARGVVAVTSLAASAVPRRNSERSRLARLAATTLLAAALALGYVHNLGNYFRASWRQGSFALDRDVGQCLRENGRRDAVVYLDYYPQSSAILLLSPVARGLRPDEISVPVREDYVRPPESYGVILYQVDWAFYELFVASRRIDAWAITPRDSAALARLREAWAGDPDVELFECERAVAVHFKSRSSAAAEKIAGFAEIALTLPQGDLLLRRQRALLAAKAFFMTREPAEGLAAMAAFRAAPPGPADDARDAGSWLERQLGRVLGLPPRALREGYESDALADVQRVAFLHAQHLVDTGRREDALGVLGEVLRIGTALDGEVLDHLARIAASYEREGAYGKAIDVYEMALRRAPDRTDLRTRKEADERRPPKSGRG